MNEHIGKGEGVFVDNLLFLWQRIEPIDYFCQEWKQQEYSLILELTFESNPP
jgi:hypothetical protein